jgi:sensor domain CHASE-containing protein
VRAHRVLVVVVAIVTVTCGRVERQAAQARTDSLERLLQGQQDSLKAARSQATEPRGS